MKKQPDFYKISRADEDDKLVQHCLIPWVFDFLLSYINGAHRENIKIQ